MREIRITLYMCYINEYGTEVLSYLLSENIIGARQIVNEMQQKIYEYPNIQSYRSVQNYRERLMAARDMYEKIICAIEETMVKRISREQLIAICNSPFEVFKLPLKGKENEYSKWELVEIWNSVKEDEKPVILKGGRYE